MMRTLYEHAGGNDALHHLEEIFYTKVFADPVTKELGFAHVIDAHRGLKITDEQRERFVALYLESLRSHLEFGSRVAQQNSHAETDDQLHPLREVPRWQWPDGSS